MPPLLWAPWAPTSTRCFLFGRRLTFLLDETLLPADVEPVTSRGDLTQNASQQNELLAPVGRGTCVPAALLGLMSICGEPSWGAMASPAASSGLPAVIAEK